MPVALNIKRELKQAKKALTEAQRKVLPAATSAALNRAAKSAHTGSVRDMRSVFTVPMRELKRYVRFQKRDKATRKRQEAGIYGIWMVPAKFLRRKRQMKKGVKAGDEFFRSAFYKKVYGNKKNIYRRKTKKRFPVKVVRINMMDTMRPTVQRNIETKGFRTFQRRLPHELNHRLKKRGLL